MKIFGPFSLNKFNWSSWTAATHEVIFLLTQSVEKTELTEKSANILFYGKPYSIEFCSYGRLGLKKWNVQKPAHGHQSNWFKFFLSAF
jgi:hypothetical protein